jgi:hypothetical protein
VKSTGAANTVDGLTFNDNVVKNLGVTSNNTTILTANDIDRLTMKRNYLWAVRNDVAIGVIVTAGVLTNLIAADNFGYRPNTTTAGGSLINVGGTTSTGIVVRNYVQTLTTTTDLLFTTSVGLAAFENRVTGVVGARASRSRPPTPDRAGRRRFWRRPLPRSTIQEARDGRRATHRRSLGDLRPQRLQVLGLRNPGRVDRPTRPARPGRQVAPSPGLRARCA